jgi:hypothetical protein
MYLKDAVAEILKSVQPLIADGAYQELKANYDQAIKPDPKVIPNVPAKPQPVNPKDQPKPPPSDRLTPIQQLIDTQLGDIAAKVESHQGVTDELEELQRNIRSFIKNGGATEALQNYRRQLTFFQHLNTITASKADIIQLLEKEKFNDIITDKLFQRGLHQETLKPFLNETQLSKLAMATDFKFIKEGIDQNEKAEFITARLDQKKSKLSSEALQELSILAAGKPQIANLLPN